MAVSDRVLVDTCIWVAFFNRPQSLEKQTVDELLDDDRATLIGPVLAEILLGFRRDEQADWVASELRGLRYLQVTWNEWRAVTGRFCYIGIQAGSDCTAQESHATRVYRLTGCPLTRLS